MITLSALLAAAVLATTPAAPAAIGSFPAATDHRGRVYLTEGDALVRYAPRGRRATVAVFPSRLVPAPERQRDGTPRGGPILMPAVPSGVTAGPDGAFYVGELTGFPFPAGRARVWRVVPGRPPEVYAAGFTAVIDVAWGPDGRLYVLEIARNGLRSGDRTGALVRVNPRGRHQTVASAGLPAPTALRVQDRVALVTTCGDCPGEGRVVRVPLTR